MIEPIKLTDLDPRWLKDRDDNRVGVSFKCPCCLGKPEAQRAIVTLPFQNPMEGPQSKAFTDFWYREGITFETLTLAPSINGEDDGHWHGYLRAGLVT